MGSPSPRDERGAVVVSHVLVTVLVVVLFAGAFQLAGALYVRGILTDAAAVGARAAALVYAPTDAAPTRIRTLIDQAAPGVAVSDVRVSHERVGLGDREFVVVEIDATLPLFGPWGIPGGLTVRGHALQEKRE